MSSLSLMRSSGACSSSLERLADRILVDQPALADGERLALRPRSPLPSASSVRSPILRAVLRAEVANDQALRRGGRARRAGATNRRRRGSDPRTACDRRRRRVRARRRTSSRPAPGPSTTLHAKRGRRALRRRAPSATSDSASSRVASGAFGVGGTCSTHTSSHTRPTRTRSPAPHHAGRLRRQPNRTDEGAVRAALVHHDVLGAALANRRVPMAHARIRQTHLAPVAPPDDDARRVERDARGAACRRRSGRRGSEPSGRQMMLTPGCPDKFL